MGHRANFLVIENGVAQAYYDNMAGLGAVFAIADGPGSAIEDIKKYAPTSELLDWAYAEGGFLIDFDQRLVIVFGELDDPQDEFADLEEEEGDEDPDELDEEIDEDEESARSTRYALTMFKNYFKEIAPHWQGWRLRYDDRGVDAFAGHLQLRGITSVEVQEPSHPENPVSIEFQA